MSVEYFNSIWPLFKTHESSINFINYGLNWSEERVRAAVKTGDFKVLEHDGGIIGVLFFRRINSELSEIDMILISLPFLRKGFAEKLMRLFLMEMVPPHEVWLEVHEKNLSALNLYRKLGFKEVSTRPNYYKDGGSAILMSIKI
jgi:ribosomal-protein-alanine N-acetyltransferase